MTGVDLALLALRLVLGGAYAAHGARKLGWGNPQGLTAFRASIERRGFRPPALWAAAAVVAEVGGGLLVAVGLLTPIGVALLVAQSLTIVALVAPRGFWHDAGGVEYPLLLGTAAFAVGLAGPGSASLDAALGLRFDAALAAAAIGLGAAGAVTGLALRRTATA